MLFLLQMNCSWTNTGLIFSNDFMLYFTFFIDLFNYNAYIKYSRNSYTYSIMETLPF